jgi:hypothetical protein
MLLSGTGRNKYQMKHIAKKITNEKLRKSPYWRRRINSVASPEQPCGAKGKNKTISDITHKTKPKRNNKQNR